MPQLGRQRLALPAPASPGTRRPACADDRLDLAPRDLDRRHRSWSESTSGCRATSSTVTSPREAERRLQLAEPRGHQPGPIEVDREPACALGILGPARLHRDVAPIELPPQPLAQLALERRQIARQLGARD